MKILLLLTAILLSCFAIGQDEIPAQSEACDTSLTHWTADVLPAYEGGHEKLLHDLNNNLKSIKNINGTCRIDFMINCKGKAWGFKIDSGLDSEFEDKFLNVFSDLQHWTPGKYNNENVDCSYTLFLAVENGRIKEDTEPSGVDGL